MIVRGVRAAGRAAGKVIDAEDRRVLGTLLAALVMFLAGAGALGLAIRLFELARSL